MQVTVHSSIADIDRDAWNNIAGDGYPFLRHEFLQLAEETNCVSAETGWLPRHLTISDGNALRAAMPLYEKQHSWGEFVFDWAWANAYQQSGYSYYPKLVSAIPFTPASSARLLLADDGDSEAADGLLRAAVQLAEDTECSSLHFLFPAANDMSALQRAGFLIRKDCQFHWHNNNYTCFDEFLKTFTSVKRKKVHRDRRRVYERDIQFRRIKGTDIDAAVWSTVYQLISRTFLIRGNKPYFDEAFFCGIGRQIPDSVLVILAERNATPLAAAVFFESNDRLYGRYWGSDGHYDALHFETCYYQGIDYCIETGKKVFEPGTQGEHKISRGFSPVSTYSAHWLAHPQFSSAIERYLNDEQRHIDRYMDAVDAHTPYKKPVGKS